MLDRFRTLLAKTILPKPADGESTGIQDPKKKAQSFGAVGADNTQLVAPKPATITTWRAMRNQPTIALARAVANGPIRQAKFTVGSKEGTPEARVEFITEQWATMERQLIHDLLYARDYGWQAFEKVFETDDAGMQGLCKLKALLPELTSVVLTKDHGKYDGLLNGKRSTGFGTTAEHRTHLPAEKTLWFTAEREGTNYYGEAVMERCRSAYNSWLETDARAKKYTTMVAGPIPMIQFPQGESEDSSGQTIANFTIAQRILEGLSKCQGVVMPNVVMSYVDALVNAGVDPAKIEAWKIDFIEAKGLHGKEFIDQKRTYETDMMRGWLVPERAATEGIHGTKAESETQGDLVVVTAEYIMADMIQLVNRWVIDQLLVINYGEEARGSVWVVVEEIDREKKKLLQEIVKATIGNPTNVDLLLEQADMEAIYEIVGLPPAKDLAEQIKRDEERRLNPPPPPVMVPQPPPPVPEPVDDDTSMALPDEPTDKDIAWLDLDDERRCFEFRDSQWFSIEISRDEVKAIATEEGEAATGGAGDTEDTD